jgi:hypothetical protein
MLKVGDVIASSSIPNFFATPFMKVVFPLPISPKSKKTLFLLNSEIIFSAIFFVSSGDSDKNEINFFLFFPFYRASHRLCFLNLYLFARK